MSNALDSAPQVWRSRNKTISVGDTVYEKAHPSRTYVVRGIDGDTIKVFGGKPNYGSWRYFDASKLRRRKTNPTPRKDR